MILGSGYIRYPKINHKFWVNEVKIFIQIDEREKYTVTTDHTHQHVVSIDLSSKISQIKNENFRFKVIMGSFVFYMFLFIRSVDRGSD